MQIYVPKDIMKWLDDNKGSDHSRESLMIKMLGHLIENGVDIDKVKQRGKYVEDIKSGAVLRQ